MAHLCTGIALLVVGGFLLVSSVTALLEAQPAVIGTVDIFGFEIWRGWLIIAVRFDSTAAVFLGHAKRAPARKLHDKVLNADADMNRADWRWSRVSDLAPL